MTRQNRGRGSKAVKAEPRSAMVDVDTTHTLENRFPVFAAFVRAYLHEDFASEHGTPERALAAFVDAASPEERTAMQRECTALAALVDTLPLGDIRTLLTDRLRAAWWPSRKRDVSRLLRVVL